MPRRPTPNASAIERPPHWTLDVTPAPGDLALVQDFLNTAAGGPRRERLESARALADWLAAWSLPLPTEGIDDDGLRRAREIRAGLHGLVRAHPDGTPDDAGVRQLDDALAGTVLRVRVATGGILLLQPDGDGVERSLGRLLDAVLHAQRVGEWRRLKLCGNPECRVVYFSPPRITRWCSRRCGNLVAKRASRRRGRE